MTHANPAAAGLSPGLPPRQGLYDPAREHDDPVDRPPEVFGGEVTLHFSPERQPYLLLPVVPPK